MSKRTYLVAGAISFAVVMFLALRLVQDSSRTTVPSEQDMTRGVVGRSEPIRPSASFQSAKREGSLQPIRQQPRDDQSVEQSIPTVHVNGANEQMGSGSPVLGVSGDETKGDVSPDILEKREEVLEWARAFASFNREFLAVLDQEGPRDGDTEAFHGWQRTRAEWSELYIDYLRELQEIVPEAVEIRYGLPVPGVDGAAPTTDYRFVGSTSLHIGYIVETIFGGEFPPELMNLGH